MPREHSLNIHVSLSAKKLHCMFLGKDAIIITPKDSMTIFFPGPFPRKASRKIGPKERVNTG